MKRKERLPPFAAITNEEMLSQAYTDLKHSAAKAYPHFKRMDGIRRKKAGYDGTFDFTYAEARKLGFAKGTFSAVIAELNAKGFINIVKQGGMRGCGRSNAKYRLSERWRDYGKPPVYDRATCSFREPFINRPRYKSEPD